LKKRPFRGGYRAENAIFVSRHGSLVQKLQRT
jgi:hypothetical protein